MQNKGKKDLTEKYLESFRDVFADIHNVLLFQEELIREEELEDGSTESTYKAEEGNVRNQFRDTSKYYRNCQYKLALYDILYIPEKLQPYVNDYKIHVFNVAFLPKETRDKFKSDFKIVADFFTEKRLEIYEPEKHKEQIKHVEAVLNMIRVFTNDSTYDKIESGIVERAKAGEVITMCTFAEEMTNKGIKIGEARGIEIGEARGIEMGIAQDKINVARNLLDILSDEVIAEKVELDIQVVRSLRS